MQEINNYNPEFVDAWDELHSRLKAPGFDLEAYLAEVSGKFSPETIKELRIAAKLPETLRLSAEYDLWRREEAARDTSRRHKVLKIKKFALVAAALAVLLLAIIIPPMKGPHEPMAPGIEEPSEFPPLLLTSIALAFEEKAGIPADSFFVDPDGKPLKTRVSNLKNIMYDDLDGDGTIEIIYNNKGYVLCLDHKGTYKWHFNVHDKWEYLKANFADEMQSTLDFVSSNAVRPGQPYYGYGDYDKIIDLDDSYEKLFKLMVNMIGTYDFDGDGNKEVLLYFPGALFVLDHETGQPQEVDDEGHIHIKLLDGELIASPRTIADIDGENGDELLIYKSTTWPRSKEGKDLRTVPIGEKDYYYIFNGENFNDRGFYAADISGKEMWHLNLPYHCDTITVFDWDEDGDNEIFINSYIPNNDFMVKYTENYHGTVAENFNWDIFPPDIKELIDWPWKEEFPDVGNPGFDSALFVMVMNEDGEGSVEDVIRFKSKSQHSYMSTRVVDYGGYKQIEAIQYNDYSKDEKDEPYWYTPWVYDGNEFIPLDEREGGYPEMRWHDGLFGFDIGDGPRRVFGLSHKGEIKVVDEDYKDIASYSIKDHPEYQKISPKIYHCTDALVFDVKDIDGDEYPEILAGFGPLHAPWELAGDDPATSIIKVFTMGLEPYRPDLGLDTIEVEGPIIRAGFEDLDNNGKMDILIIADRIYSIPIEK